MILQVFKRMVGIKGHNNPMQALAYAAYDAIHEEIIHITNHEFGAGKLILIGGIQVYTLIVRF